MAVVGAPDADERANVRDRICNSRCAAVHIRMRCHTHVAGVFGRDTCLSPSSRPPRKRRGSAGLPGGKKGADAGGQAAG